MQSFENLKVWQKSIEFVATIYKVTNRFPKQETFGLSDQLRRAVVSIPSNIAEGCNRRSEKEFANFLHISYGSCAEVKTQLIIAEKLKYIDSDLLISCKEELAEIERMLNSLIRRIEK